jgi:hypothetical protein
MPRNIFVVEPLGYIDIVMVKNDKLIHHRFWWRAKKGLIPIGFPVSR